MCLTLLSGLQCFLNHRVCLIMKISECMSKSYCAQKKALKQHSSLEYRVKAVLTQCTTVHAFDFCSYLEMLLILSNFFPDL